MYVTTLGLTTVERCVRMAYTSKQNAEMYHNGTNLDSIYDEGIVLLGEAIINRARLDYVDALKKKRGYERIYPTAPSVKRASIKSKINECDRVIGQCRIFFRDSIIVSFSGADYNKIIKAIEDSVE